MFYYNYVLISYVVQMTLSMIELFSRPVNYISEKCFNSKIVSCGVNATLIFFRANFHKFGFEAVSDFPRP